MSAGFYRAEMAGIKFHAAIDTVIRATTSTDLPGLWLDWMAQGHASQETCFMITPGRI